MINGIKACTGNISSKISAFQNQIQKTDEENKKEQAIKKEISSRNLKNWNQRINNIKEEPEIRSNESIAVQPPESKSNATQVINYYYYYLLLLLILLFIIIKNIYYYYLKREKLLKLYIHMKLLKKVNYHLKKMILLQIL